MIKILIIEDDPYVRRMYARMFGFQKFEVDMAVSGKDGLEKAQNNPPQLILLDLMMPSMNGIEVLKKLKENPITAKIAVIILTNVDNENTVKEAFELGARAYLVKSDFSPEAVIDEINKFIKSNIL